MAEQGYWMICEEIYSGDKKNGKPAVYIGMVEGFFDLQSMAKTRLEVLQDIKYKLQRNINKMVDQYQDVPEPSFSDSPHPDCGLPNAVHFFIPLSEVFVKRDKRQKVA